MRRALQLLVMSVAVLCFIIIILYGDHNVARFSDYRFANVPTLTLETQHQPKFHDIGILKGLGVEFLSNFKNPCWYELRGPQDDHEKSTNFYSSLSRSLSLSKYRYRRQTNVILRCLPYFFLVGQPKCATTDVFQRINIHPDVVEPVIKGPHWWTRRRFGPPYAPQPVTFSEYLDVFNASKIEEWTDMNEASQDWFHKITGDGSTSTLWDSSLTMSFLHKIMAGSMHEPITKDLLSRRRGTSALSGNQTYSTKINSVDDGHVKDGDKNLQEFKYHQEHSSEDGIVLPFTVADVIHSVLPKSRIIVVIREPVSRLYSSYLFFTKKTSLSPEDFDENVKNSIKMWKDCTRQYSDRTCAYNKTLQNSLDVRLYNGLYSIFIRDWLKVFQQKQVLVVRMEDYHQNITKTLAAIFSHLDLRKLTEEEGKRVNLAPIRNKNRKKPEIGRMPESTAGILRAFYKPYNRDLANLLQDSRFTWEDIYTQESAQHPG